MNRDDMIRILVDSSVAAVAADRETSWLRELFIKGFRGFANMSSAELLRELQYRDLAGFEDSVEDEEFGDAGDHTGSESLIGSNRPRHAEDGERD